MSESMRDGNSDGVDLDRVWVNVAAEVWSRSPGRLERSAARLLGSPGLARALVATPSLLLPWLISSVVVLGVGVAAEVSAGQPLVWLIAPVLAAVGMAYAYGPGVDPAWELSCSMPRAAKYCSRRVESLLIAEVQSRSGPGSRCYQHRRGRLM